METARQRALQEVDDRKRESLEKSKKARDEFEKTKKELFGKEIELERKAMEVRFKRKVQFIKKIVHFFTTLEIGRGVVQSIKKISFHEPLFQNCYSPLRHL